MNNTHNADKITNNFAPYLVSFLGVILMPLILGSYLKKLLTLAIDICLLLTTYIEPLLRLIQM